MVVSSGNTISYYNGQKYNSILKLNEDGRMHGAKRVLVFCLMTAILPTILIIIPLYLRHHVFADIISPVAESDVLAISEGVSSIFCESLVLKMNSTFNAFQLPNKPKKSGKLKHIKLKKSMSLPDDTLEYWGFYLLKGSIVKLKVCSRFVGARILVVRGDKNLNTCNLMKENFGQFGGARMDADYNKVKVFYENEKPAEVVGLLDILNNDINEENDDNKAEEEITDNDDENKIDLSLQNPRRKKSNFDYGDQSIDAKENDTFSQETKPVPKLRHSRRHLREWQEKIEALKRNLENKVDRSKRSISPLDVHIKHGGNAINVTDINEEGSESSVSSFETELMNCYDGKILLPSKIQPSRHCINIEYVDQANHMITEHTVASDGYYYYIFYSDNDFVHNDMHAVFDIYKTTYGFRNESSGKECINQTLCEFPIHFLSNEIVIVEVPTRDGLEQEADDITLLMSTCRPRMEVYVIFPILVLVLVMVCAFL